MTRPSLLRFVQHWFLFLTLAVIAIACGGRSDEGLLPPDNDASIDGASRGDGGANRDGAGGADGSIDGVIVLPDGAIVLPDGARIDGAGGAGGGTGPGDGGGGRLPDGGTTATLVRITLDPPMVTLGIATSQTLKVTGVYSDGTSADITQQGITFASNAVGTATVSGAGVVTAVAGGMTTVTATRQPENLTATASIVVTSAMVRTIEVTPLTQTIGVGGTVNFTATATLSDGSHQDVTNSVTWSSSDMAVASISGGGLARGVAAGMATVKATMPVGGVSGSATLTVTASPLVSIAITPPNPILPIGVSFTFKATATYANGMTGDVTNSVLWSSSNPAVGTIGAANGTGTTLAAGASMITASLTQGGMMVAGTTNLTVTPAKLVSITVAPAMNTVIVGLTKQLTATGRFDNNTSLDITQSASWSSSNATSAFVSTAAGSQGLVSGLAAGMATITATMNGINGTATVTVVDAKLVSITIAPAAPSVPLGATVPLTASGTYDTGLMADVTSLVTWSTDAAAIATISNAAGTNGQIKGATLGMTVARAVSGAISAQVPVTVTAAVPQSIEVAPANPSIQVTRTQQMSAIAVYSDASRVDVTTQAAWTTGRAATATISNGAGTQGLLTAVAVGTTSVTATWSGLMGTTNVTVTPAIPTGITVTPFTATINTGGTQAYTAVVIYDIGTQATVTGQCMWTSSDVAVATIMLGGGGGGGGGNATATGRGGGMVTITCNYTGAGVMVSGTAQLTVIGPTLPVSLNITPDTAAVTVGGMVQFTATVTNDNGTTANVTNTSTWTVLSDAGTVAGVSTTGNARGLATGLAAGTATIQASYAAMGVTVVGTSTLTVEGMPTGVTISPGNASILVSQMQAYTTSVLFSDGSSRTVAANSTEMLCTSSDTTVATIGAMGNNRQGQCLAPGTVTLTCTFTPTGSTTGVNGTTSLECLDRIPTGLEVVPTTSTVPQGQTVTYLATARFSDGSTLNITTSAEATWLSSNVGIANVNNSGMMKGQATTTGQGTVTITVTFRGVTGTAMLTVGPVAPIGLTISPTGGTYNVGATGQYQAILQMSDQTSMTVTAMCNWTASPPAADGGMPVATVSNAGATKGLVTAVSMGSSTITATYTGTAGSVSPATVRITVE
ncbi:MAG TPA: Ig-like domain-containing protein [Polyangiaceae bacterium]|nr:Ig-like domain-containing protein [Polyangiaceae bacterium]